MNPYQRIIREGVVLQPGSVDTYRVFTDLTTGLDLHGKTVIDVGCNLGEMCRLAASHGASVLGVDCNPDYIRDAIRLNPNLPFWVATGERVFGNYDIAIAIASSVFQYVGDQTTFLQQMARISRTLVMSLWTTETDPAPVMTWSTTRRLWVPSTSAFTSTASRFWGQIEWVGSTASPDGTPRRVVRLSLPTAAPAKAIILYGPSHSGKTTRACDLARVGYEHLELDSLFISYWMNGHRDLNFSVSDFVDAVWARNDPAEVQEYLDFHSRLISDWLRTRVNLDVVVEGYDPIYPQYREMLREVLREWKGVREVDATVPGL